MQSKGKCSTLVLLVLLSMRKVLEVNPLWESCLYEVAEAAFSPNVSHTHIWNPSNFCFVLFCFGAFFSTTQR